MKSEDLKMERFDLIKELSEYLAKVESDASTRESYQGEAEQSKEQLLKSEFGKRLIKALTFQEKSIAFYIRTLLALGDLQRFVQACDKMKWNKFDACLWCNRHINIGHASNCELQKALKAVKTYES